MPNITIQWYAGRTIELPAAYDTIKQTAGVPEHRPATPKGQLINPVGLQGMPKVIFVQRVDARPTKRHT